MICQKCLKTTNNYNPNTKKVTIDWIPLNATFLKRLDNKPYRSWGISKDQYNHARARIETDRTKATRGEIQYILSGKDPNQDIETRDDLGTIIHHNCLSWALRILDCVNPGFRKNLKIQGNFIYNPKVALPKLEGY